MVCVKPTLALRRHIERFGKLPIGFPAIIFKDCPASLLELQSIDATKRAYAMVAFNQTITHIAATGSEFPIVNAFLGTKGALWRGYFGFTEAAEKSAVFTTL